MAKVTLIKQPKTYTVMGVKFTMGEKKEVPDNIASYLDGDRRFTVDWEGKTPPPKTPGKLQAQPGAASTPAPATGTAKPAADLVAAINQVDAQLDENFDDDGKPAVAALSKLLGRTITPEERDAAFAVAVAPTRTVEPSSRVRVIKKAATGAAAPAATTAAAPPAAAAAAPVAADPTTEGAAAV